MFEYASLFDVFVGRRSFAQIAMFFKVYLERVRDIIDIYYSNEQIFDVRQQFFLNFGILFKTEICTIKR